jgi:pimeloyl-ACP methyl ester carboxylesterase
VNSIKVSQQIDRNRRNSSIAIAIAVTIIAAVTLAVSGFAQAQPGKQNVPSSNGSFGPIKQIDAGLLNVGYVEAGPTDGAPVILLHGWPYDIYSYVDVAPLLASKGYHVFVPYLRGYGTTRFLSDDTFRNGQPSVVAFDIINFMDALKIDKAIIAGFDWGARTAALAGTLQGNRFGERLSDRQPGRRQNALAPKRGARMVVPVLFCDRTRTRWL